MKKYIGLFHLMDVAVTILLLSLLVLMQSSTRWNLQMAKATVCAELKEYGARRYNNSQIITQAALEETLQTEILSIQLHWINQTLGESYIKYLINSSLGHDLSVSQIFNKSMLISRDLIEEVLQQESQSNQTVGLQHIPHLIQVFSEKLLQSHPDLPDRKVSTNNVHDFEAILLSFYESFEVNIKNLTIKPHDLFTFSKWRSLVCLPAQNLHKDDFLMETLISPPTSFSENICHWHSLVSMAEERCEPDTPIQVYNRLKSIWLQAANKTSNNVFIIFMMVLAVIYVMIDTYEHMLFFFMDICANSSVIEMILSVLSNRVPGSYYKKQLNIITYYTIIAHVCARADIITMNVSLVLIEKFTYYMLMFGLILRFMMHIHSMRLLPWIGQFIITTFMMANNLVHFSAVLGVVIFIFAIIFNLLIVDQDCPVRPLDGYESIGTSMLSVFMLTFGHGDFDQYRSNTPVIVTYVLFVIIVGLLLLNLIIAIMSATAEDLMTPEGKETLHKMEWLYEALSAEFTTSALAGRITAKWLSTNQRRAGYHVEGMGTDARVLIKVFYCQKLD